MYIYASVQVAAKFLMRKLRQYPQTWQPAEMNTFPFLIGHFLFYNSTRKYPQTKQILRSPIKKTVKKQTLSAFMHRYFLTYLEYLV